MGILNMTTKGEIDDKDFSKPSNINWDAMAPIDSNPKKNVEQKVDSSKQYADGYSTAAGAEEHGHKGILNASKYAYLLTKNKDQKTIC